MTRLRDFLAAAHRLQQTTPFKVVASVLILVAAIAAIGAYAIAATAPTETPSGAAVSAPDASAAPAQPVSEEEKLARSSIEASQKIIQDILARRSSPANVAIGIALGAGLALVVVWLGLGLTYLALVGVAAGVAWPLRYLGMPGLSQLLLGIVALTASFTALMQGLRLVLAAPHPVFAIARNMLAEAVRMRISLVFIVILIFGLAALPLLQDTENPLRYRVQAFLQYGTAGSYWVIAMLTLFFAAASVAFEQRDKQIWQTMTKPVAHWQYLLGKWLGASSLAAVLLAVCCAGIFLFTEHLRRQPAYDERPELVAASVLSEDRKVLETQVLAARRAVGPDVPLSPADKQFQDWARLYIEDERKRDPAFAEDPAMLDKVLSDLYKTWEQAFRTIAPGDARVYHFSGLSDAKRRNAPITLKYRVDSGGNMPDQLYHVTFGAGGVLILPPREVTLGPTHTLDLFPNLIDDQGGLDLEVYNGGLEPAPNGAMAMTPNPEAISFPASGLEIYYSASSYQMNFVRAAFVLWIKLAFLAMLAIACATFMSFPVACLVAFSVFLIAEGTGYLTMSLEYYDAADQAGNVQYWKIPVRSVGLAVTWMFKTYSTLKPTTRLVDGRLLDWGSVAWGAAVLCIWTAALFGAGVTIFRRRELATYSGQ